MRKALEYAAMVVGVLIGLLLAFDILIETIQRRNPDKFEEMFGVPSQHLKNRGK